MLKKAVQKTGIVLGFTFMAASCGLLGGFAGTSVAGMIDLGNCLAKNNYAPSKPEILESCLAAPIKEDKGKLAYYMIGLALGSALGGYKFANITANNARRQQELGGPEVL